MSNSKEEYFSQREQQVQKRWPHTLGLRISRYGWRGVGKRWGQPYHMVGLSKKWFYCKYVKKPSRVSRGIIWSDLHF